MKNKIFLLFGILLTGLVLFSACDSTDDTTEPITTGSISISSVPAGAEIYLDGVDKNQVTPATIANLEAGTYTVKLVKTGYLDTTVVATVVAEQTTTVAISLVASMDVTEFHTPVRLYETQGTTAAQPSGLDLSSGNAYGISGSDGGFVDIYYSSSGFLVQSAHLSSYGLTRETYFYVGSATNLGDGVDSPTKGSSWTTSIGDETDEYVFLYDEDGHYSKLRIVNFWAGGGISDPAWIEVEWNYNNTVDDKRF
ncbi:MAG: PEGA domain-containing protein [bacterium]